MSNFNFEMNNLEISGAENQGIDIRGVAPLPLGQLLFVLTGRRAFDVRKGAPGAGRGRVCRGEAAVSVGEIASAGGVAG